MNVETCSREDLELAILEHDILPTDAEGLEAIEDMTTDALRDAVRAWVAAGDETGG